MELNLYGERSYMMNLGLLKDLNWSFLDLWLWKNNVWGSKIGDEVTDFQITAIIQMRTYEDPKGWLGRKGSDNLVAN